MKKLFIYYSLSGNGDYIASVLKEKDIDIKKIKVKKELPKIKFFQILIGGYRAMTSYEDELIDFNINLKKYDEIIIGSPIWNDRLSSPIQTVLKKLELDNKKLTFILYSGSGQNTLANNYIIENYNSALIYNVKQPLKYGFDYKKMIL